ncbi:MAG: hypothetical protein IKY94_15200 [Lachnospiraceae bacterium]|nr:hypothetical protein [Lachnospiraceae bacterium]
MEFALAKKSASEALGTLGKGEFLDQDTIDTLINQFSGIMDLTGLENQSMYD